MYVCMWCFKLVKSLCLSSVMTHGNGLIMPRLRLLIKGLMITSLSHTSSRNFTHWHDCKCILAKFMASHLVKVLHVKHSGTCLLQLSSLLGKGKGCNFMFFFTIRHFILFLT